MKVKWEAARRNAGLSQREVCAHIGIGLNTIIEWEKYRRTPNVVQAKMLCNLYGCTIDDIWLEQNEKGDFTGAEDEKREAC